MLETKTTNWHPALYESPDINELVDLSRSQQGMAGDVDADYIRWMHNGNPAGTPLVALARENGADKIIGQVWLMPLRIQVGEDVQLGSHCFYGLMHPGYQRQGIFTQLMGYCYKRAQEIGVCFSYGFPNHRSYPLYVRKLGWTHIGNGLEYILPINIGRLIRRRFKFSAVRGLLAANADLASRLFFRPRPLPDQAAKFDIVQLDALTPKLDDFWERVKHKYPVMVVRDAPFIDWRFIRIPDRHYTLLAACRDRSIFAYIVLRCLNLQGIDCGMVVDFLTDPTSDGALAGKALLAHARRHFQAKKMDMAGCMMTPGAREIRFLRDQGFIRCPSWLQSQPHPILLHVNSKIPDRRLLFGGRNWFLTLGDFDAV